MIGKSHWKKVVIEVHVYAYNSVRKKEMLLGKRSGMQMRGRSLLTPTFILPCKK